MADFGDILGSLMCGLIRARRMSDEQTAVLAEYYKNNPLLEGLSVPRIRIPEFTIDMPFLIEDYVSGDIGEMRSPENIADIAQSLLKEILSTGTGDIKIDSEFHKIFIDELKKELVVIKQSNIPVMREAVARCVQVAISNTLSIKGINFTPLQRDKIVKDLRDKIAKESIIKDPTPPGVMINIKTAYIKEQASATSVTRLKITLKEEGLEWSVQASETGGIVRTLQPE